VCRVHRVASRTKHVERCYVLLLSLAASVSLNIRLYNSCRLVAIITLVSGRINSDIERLDQI